MKTNKLVDLRQRKTSEEKLNTANFVHFQLILQQFINAVWVMQLLLTDSDVDKLRIDVE